MSLLLKDGMDLAATMGHHSPHNHQPLNPSSSPHQTIPGHHHQSPSPSAAAGLLHHFGVHPSHQAAIQHHLDKNNSPSFPHHHHHPLRMPTLPGPPGFPHQFPPHFGLNGGPVISSATTNAVPTRNGLPSHLGANTLLAAAMAASVTGAIPVFPGAGVGADHHHHHHQMPSSPQHNARPSPFSFLPGMPTVSRFPSLYNSSKNLIFNTFNLFSHFDQLQYSTQSTVQSQRIRLNHNTF
jgi:hypothetical protein